MKAFFLLPLLLVACATSIPGPTKTNSGPTTSSIPRATEVSQIPSPVSAPVPASVPPSSQPSATDTMQRFPTNVQQQPVTVLSASPMTASEIARQQTGRVDTALVQLQTAADATALKLPAPAGVSGFDDALVDKNAAVSTVLELKLEILKTFSGPEYTGLQDELLRVLNKKWEDRLRAERLAMGIEIVNRHRLVDVLHELLRITRGIATKPEHRISISIHTLPQQAMFTLCPQYLSDGCVSITTDGDLPDLFRGLYTYTVQLAGYKTAQFNLDLVHFGQKQLKCALHPTNSTSLISPCTPQ